MNRRREITLLTLSHLGVLGLGFLAYLAAVLWLFPEDYAKKVSGGVIVQAMYPLYVETQRERGGYEQYRDALLDRIQLSELALENTLMSVLYGGSSYHMDRMLSYARASRLASKWDRSDEAGEYMALAIENCAQTNLARDGCSAEGVLEFLELFENFRFDRLPD